MPTPFESGRVDELVVSTVVYEDPEGVYEFLLDFPRYARYSKYLTGVEQLRGDGSPGTRYALHFAWWKITYTAHSEVTDVEPPSRIDWRITKDVDAHGCWRIRRLPELPADAPDDADVACEVAFVVRFDPDSADASAVDLPRFVSIGWVVQKVLPLVRNEAERVVRRAVADLEGRRREVDLTIRTDADRIDDVETESGT